MDETVLKAVISLADKGGSYTLWAILLFQTLQILKIAVQFAGAYFIIKISLAKFIEGIGNVVVL